MSERLPLFPLGTVLFPGLVLPLHIFEDRYRALVRHLTSQSPEPGDFGVVAIRAAGSVSTNGDRGRRRSITFYEIGCTAEVRQVTEHPDGRFDLVTVGRRRFRIADVDTDPSPTWWPRSSGCPSRTTTTRPKTWCRVCSTCSSATWR